MKQLFFLVVMLAMFSPTQSQTYTTFKTGSNTWGGAYVAPVWSKTYDFNLKPYTSPDNKSGSSGTASSSYSGAPATRLSGYGKQSRWNFSTDFEKDARRYQQMKETLKEAIDLHFALLDSAIVLFNRGHYHGSNAVLDQLLYSFPKTKYDFNSFGNELYMKYNDAIHEFLYIRYCYKYFCLVKLHQYNDALNTYNLFLSRYQPSSNPYDPKNMYPLNPQFYYVLDSAGVVAEPGFKQVGLPDRFKADLFLVETLAGLGKTAEANTLMEMTLKFYSPRFKQMDPYYAQMAINYFYLNKAEEAAKYLEYYCNVQNSNNARMAIIEELLFNHKSTVLWTETNAPACFKMIENNLVFLDELAKTGKVIDRLYFEKNWNELYNKRSSNQAKFEQKVELSIAEIEQKTGSYSPARLQAYITALVKNGNTEKITRIMEIISTNAEKEKNRVIQSFAKSYQEMAELYRKSTKESAARYTQIKEGYDKERAKKSRMYVTEHKISLKRAKEWHEESIKKYWLNHYESMARPAASALAIFKLPDFAEAGGVKYLQQYAAPYLEELSKFTAEEVSYINYYMSLDLKKCGIYPKFKKSRNYPDNVD